MVNRLGKVDEGSSVTDYDEEEIQRKFSITSALAYAEWGKTKINLIDTPGYNIFMHETEAALLAAESALVLVHAVAGVEVQTEKVWGFCEKYALPRVVVINQLDRDRASFERALSAIREAYGRTVVPVQLPLGEEKNFRGVIDLVRMKALLYDANGSGKAKESDIPPELSDAAAKAREGLSEMVAEGNDKLMEEFFEKGTIPVEDLVPGLKQAVTERRLYPVVASAGLPNIGSDALVNLIVDYLPSPVERREVTGLDREGGNPVKRKIADDQPVCAYVFKTVADAFAGRVTYFKVMSGVVKNEANLTNFNRGGVERLSHIAVIQGKTSSPVAELRAGDIGAVAKLRDTLTGDTLGDKAAAQGRFKRQTGGHGQYGDCKIKMEPLPRDTGFEFVNDIFGGSIPKNYIPSVEKGIIEAASKGYLAGYPVVDFRVILYDGSYHEVDSSDLAFKIAGSFAFKKCMEQARPCLLEPIMNVEVNVPQNNSGDIAGNLNGRRGRILGMDPKAGSTLIKAQAPLAEMLTYASDLTSMTQGRGTYSMEFSHYDVVPQHIADKIVAAGKAAGVGKEEEEA